MERCLKPRSYVFTRKTKELFALFVGNLMATMEEDTADGCLAILCETYAALRFTCNTRRAIAASSSSENGRSHASLRRLMLWLFAEPLLSLDHLVKLRLPLREMLVFRGHTFIAGSQQLMRVLL